jgi:integrase-like protein
VTSRSAAAISSGIHALEEARVTIENCSLGNQFHMGPLLYHKKEVGLNRYAVCSKALSRKGAFYDITSTTHDRGLQVRNLSSQTQATEYVQQVSMFARHFNKSPEILGPEEIRSYKVYLTNEKKLAPSSIIIAVAALRFLYKITLRKDSVHFA